MADKLKLEIVTPEGVTCSEDVDMVTLPGVEGEMGIYPQHVPLMTQIVGGEIVVRKSGKEFYLAVGDGFVEITGDCVSVLTDMAIRAENIDEIKVEEARQKAQRMMQEKLSAEELAAVQASLVRTSILLQVKRHRRKQSG